MNYKEDKTVVEINRCADIGKRECFRSRFRGSFRFDRSVSREIQEEEYKKKEKTIKIRKKDKMIFKFRRIVTTRFFLFLSTIIVSVIILHVSQSDFNCTCCRNVSTFLNSMKENEKRERERFFRRKRIYRAT